MSERETETERVSQSVSQSINETDRQTETEMRARKRLTIIGLGVGVQQTRESRGPDVRLVRGVGDQVHGLELLAEDDGERALVRVDAHDLLAAERVGRLALANLLDR